MAPLPISFAAYKRSGFPQAITQNCYPEKAPTQQSQPLALISRGGLEPFKVVGAMPARGLFQKTGLFDNSALIPVGGTVYTLTDSGVATAITGTTIPGTGRVDIAAGQDADQNSVARIATGTALYMVTKDAVTLEDFPTGGGPGAVSVAFHRGYWIAQEAGTDQFYYQLPGGTTWDALDFATAEYAPDPGVAVRTRGDQIVFLNTSTTEVWALTGQSTPPLAPYGGLNFDFGCRARDTAVNCKGALLWVDDDCNVRMFEGGDAEIISDNGLAEQIRRVDAMDLRASTYSKDGHVFYTLTLGSQATWIYDLSMQAWQTANSNSFDYWRAHLFCNIGDSVLAADATSAQVWRLDPDRRTDDTDTFTIEFTAFAEAKDGPVPCSNLQLTCRVGDSPRTGQGSDPIIRMRFSDDQGETFGRWYDRPLGKTGAYRAIVRWIALGQIAAPYGRIFQFQISDPVGRRFSDLAINVT